MVLSSRTRQRVNVIQLTEYGPPVAPPATQIYETIIFFASSARWYCMSETFIIKMRHLWQWAVATWERPPESSRCSWRRKRNEIWQIIGACHLRFVTHHNMPISMNVKTIFLVLSSSSQKSWSWGFMDESFLVVLSAMSPQGQTRSVLNRQGRSLLSSLLFCGPLSAYSVWDTGIIQSNTANANNRIVELF